MKYSLLRITAAFIIALIVTGAATGASDALTADEILAAIGGENRTSGDSARDAGRKPAQVLEFLGLQKGMTVLDVMASAGWYTEVLALSLGESGKVHAHNTPGMLRFRGGANDKALNARLADGRLANVSRINSDFDGMGMNSEVDLAITALNFHDIYNSDPEGAVQMLREIKSTLKPGGILGVIDHNGAAEANNAGLHRMLESQAIEAAKKAGFAVETSDILKNSDDDHTKMVFAGDIRGKTDRFLLKLTSR
jgi:predicted methyltransferase|tara:strand:- start:1090 stop:1845 length:756 start_codon:yes stop_codon:yes gene_type:complete